MYQILSAFTSTNSFNPHILQFIIICILLMRKMRQREEFMQDHSAGK